MTIRRLRDGEEGMTLVELLVVVVLLGVVGSIVTSSVIRGFQTTRTVENRIAALAELQQGLQRVSRELRVADPLLIHSGEEAEAIGAVVYRDDKRYEHTYEVESNAAGGYDLVETVVEFDPASATTGTTLRSDALVQRITNDLSTDPVFQYYNQSGTQLTSNYVSAAQLEITLVAGVEGDQEPVRATTTVNVRNTRFG